MIVIVMINQLINQQRMRRKACGAWPGGSGACRRRENIYIYIYIYVYTNIYKNTYK